MNLLYTKESYGTVGGVIKVNGSVLFIVLINKNKLKSD